MIMYYFVCLFYCCVTVADWLQPVTDKDYSSRNANPTTFIEFFATAQKIRTFPMSVIVNP